MVITSVPNRTLGPTLMGWKHGYLVFDRKRQEPRQFPWQQHYGYYMYLVPFVINISGAKFEEHCFILPEIFSVYLFLKPFGIICCLYKMTLCHWLHSKELWLVQENQATVKLNSNGFLWKLTVKKIKILQKLMFKKMLEKSRLFGVERMCMENLWLQLQSTLKAIQLQFWSFEVLKERSVRDSGN